ncbi:MAG: hypothetical protein M1812_004485 [Candelaria pacifica]|nr:MAG: hypothetical protein M1812_004485 [Candelaria pacifica]
MQSLSAVKLLLIEVALIREALDAGKETYPNLAQLCQVPIDKTILRQVIQDDDARRGFQQRQDDAYSTNSTENPQQRQHKSIWYKVEQKLGEGAYGQVERVRDAWTAEVFARKSVFFRRGTRDACLEEVRIMQRLHHPHMVELISTCIMENRLEMLMLPVADENLDRYLARFSDQANPAKGQVLLRSWFGCLASGLAYMHESFVRHKDIKPKNILVKGSNVLYTDFGIAREFVNTQYHSTSGLQRGTLMYAAPELARYDRRNPSADVFSLGCVYMEMLTCLSPETLARFRDYRTDDDGDQTYYVNIDWVLQWSKHIEDSVADPTLTPLFNTVRQMLNTDAAERPRAAKVASTLAATAKRCRGCYTQSSITEVRLAHLSSTATAYLTPIIQKCSSEASS